MTDQNNGQVMLHDVPILVGERLIVERRLNEQHRDCRFYSDFDSRMLFAWIAWQREALNSEPSETDPGNRTVEPKIHRLFAAIRLRSLLQEVLEALLAHFCANAQAPRATGAWLMSYRTEDLANLANKLRSDPWEAPVQCPSFGEPRALVAHVFGVGLASKDKEFRRAEIDSLISIIRIAAQSYNFGSTRESHNALKHGLRTSGSLWKLLIGPHQPTIDASPQSDKLEIAPDFGASFVEPNSRKVNGYRMLTRRSTSVSWDPKRELGLLEVAAKMLHNLYITRQVECDHSKQKVFYFPVGDIDLDTISDIEPVHVTLSTEDKLLEHPPLFSKEAALERVTRDAFTWVERLREFSPRVYPEREGDR